MDEDERAEFAEQTRRVEGAIVATSMVVSQSLIDDAAFDSARECEAAARAFYDDPACVYRHLTPAEYEYSPGPFAYRSTPGDLPPGSVLLIGRVQVTRNQT